MRKYSENNRKDYKKANREDNFRGKISKKRIYWLVIVFLSLTISTSKVYSKIRGSCDGLLNDFPIIHGQKNGKTVVLEPKINLVEQVSIIVPIYREWNNGNLINFIRTLQKQSLPSELINVVFVVNNSLEVAKTPNHPTLIENQKTIKYLKSLISKFKIQVLDLSTEGIELSEGSLGVTANMGLLRQKGNEFALKATQVKPDRHVLVQMDADTLFDSEFLRGIATLYSMYDIGALFVQRGVQLDENADDSTFRTHYKYTFSESSYSLGMAISYGRLGVGSPQISARASSFVNVGGVPIVAHNEDFGLTRRLSQETIYYYSDVLTIYSQDRSRLDGFDAKRRHEWNHCSTIDRDQSLSCTWDYIHYKLNLKLVEDIKSNFQANRLSFDDGQELFRKLRIQLEGEELINPQYRLPSDSSELLFAPLHLNADFLFSVTGYPGAKLFSLLVDLMTEENRNYYLDRYWKVSNNHDKERDFREKMIFNFINGFNRSSDQNFIEGCKKHRDDIFIRKLCDNKSELRIRLEQYIQAYSSTQEVFNQLAMDYPDWLFEFWETPNKRDKFHMDEIIRILIRAHNDPNSLPELQELLSRILN